MADTPQPDPQTFALRAGDTGRVDLFSPPHLRVGEIDTVSYGRSFPLYELLYWGLKD
jgi:hypothetical protein